MEGKQKITGIILQPLYPNCLFEGSIARQKDGSFDGRLSDRWGDSRIEGILNASAGEMSFRKRYLQKNDIIFYSFRKEGGIWVGSYTGSAGGVGEAQCEIYKRSSKIDWNKRLTTETFSMETAEANAKSLIQMMVDQGFFRETTNPVNGEETIELTEKAKRFTSPDKN